MPKNKTHRIAVIAMLSACASILMFFDFPIPFLIPNFIKMDFSDLPALLGAYSLGPVAGVTICLIKNLFNLLSTQTAGIGELSNFLLGCCFVLPAGLFYKNKKSRKTAILGAVIGAVCMGIASIPINYYLIFPAFSKFYPIDAIVKMYQTLRPNVNGLLDCLLLFNAPFTLLKGMLDMIIALLIYKPLSPILHK